MPSIEYKIVITDQHYENNHYVITIMQQCKCMKWSGDFLSVLCLFSCD